MSRSSNVLDIDDEVQQIISRKSSGPTGFGFEHGDQPASTGARVGHAPASGSGSASGSFLRPEDSGRGESETVRLRAGSLRLANSSDRSSKYGFVDAARDAIGAEDFKGRVLKDQKDEKLKARWLSETRVKDLEDFWMYTMRGIKQDPDGIWRTSDGKMADLVLSEQYGRKIPVGEKFGNWGAPSEPDYPNEVVLGGKPQDCRCAKKKCVDTCGKRFQLNAVRFWSNCNFKLKSLDAKEETFTIQGYFKIFWRASDLLEVTENDPEGVGGLAKCLAFQDPDGKHVDLNAVDCKFKFNGVQNQNFKIVDNAANALPIKPTNIFGNCDQTTTSEWVSVSKNGLITYQIDATIKIDTVMNVERYPWDRHAFPMFMSARTGRRDHRKWMLFDYAPTVDKANFDAVVQYRADKKAGKKVAKVRPKWRTGWEDMPTYGECHVAVADFEIDITSGYGEFMQRSSLWSSYTLDDDGLQNPQALIIVRLDREPYFCFFNVVLPTFMIVMVSFSSFLVLSDEPIYEYGAITITTLLVQVGFKFITQKLIPQKSYLTVIDMYLLLALFINLMVYADNVTVYLRGIDAQSPLLRDDITYTNEARGWVEWGIVLVWLVAFLVFVIDLFWYGMANRKTSKGITKPRWGLCTPNSAFRPFWRTRIPWPELHDRARKETKPDHGEACNPRDQAEEDKKDIIVGLGAINPSFN